MSVLEDIRSAGAEMPDDANDLLSRQAEFVKLLGQNYRTLYACAVSLGADLHQADDIMQETSILLWQKFEEFEPGTSFIRWGRTIVRNVFRSQRRSQWRRKHVFNTLLVEKLFEMQSAAEEVLEIRLIVLQQCLKKLPPSDRKLVEAFYRRGDSLTEKANETGRSPNSLHKAISRIRLRLSHCIDRELGIDRD